MGMPDFNILSEKAKARVVDDIKELGKAVVAVLLSELSRILGGYSEDMIAKVPTNCYKNSIKKEGEVK